MRVQSNAQSYRTQNDAQSQARPPSDGSIVNVDGKRIDAYSANLLQRAEGLSGMDFQVTQGGFNAGGVAASAGTHDGAGSLDISTAGKSPQQIEQMVKGLREAGFAAWYRSGSAWQGNEHIHAVAIGAPGLSSEAQQQVDSYLQGRDGLAGNGRDPHLDTIGRPVPSWVNGASSVPGSGGVASAGAAPGGAGQDRYGETAAEERLRRTQQQEPEYCCI